MQHRFAFLAVSALALLGTAAQAEDYHAHSAPTVSALSRNAVQAEATQAAQARNQNIPAAAVSQGALASSLARSQVQAQAVLAAHAPDQNVSSGSRVNSQVISTLPNPAAAQARADGVAPRTY